MNPLLERQALRHKARVHIAEARRRKGTEFAQTLKQWACSARRQSLLDTLKDLRSKEQPMDIERAKAVATVASVLVDTARVENDYLKITGQDRSNFLESAPDGVSDIPRIDGPAAHNPFPSVTRHRMAA